MDFLVRAANDARYGTEFGDTQHFSHKRKPFISVYDGAAAAMVGRHVLNWNRDQREFREERIRRAHGWRPIYRINVRFKERP
jgi:hypothetical protein